MKDLLKKVAATNIAFFHGYQADTLSLCWNDNYSETGGNVICSNSYENRS